MNSNGLAVLVGIILIIAGTLNILFENFRFLTTLVLIIIGTVAMVIGIEVDKLE